MNRLLLAASLSLVPAAVSAQRCMGGASFADRRAQVGADASFGTGARSVGGDIGVGGLAGPFASLGFGTAHDDDIDDDATLFGATAGVGLRLPPGQSAQLCPFISAQFLRGVQLETGERLSAQTFALGASVGMARSVTPVLEVVPFASAALLTQVTTFALPPFGAEAAATDNYYAVSLGAGLVLGKAITIRPSTTLTVAEGRTTPSYGLRFAFGFGAVPRRAPPREGEGSLATVWLNTRSGVYYCRGSTLYGATPHGAFMTERQALASGATPEYGRRC
jgi:hypothetical protein